MKKRTSPIWSIPPEKFQDLLNTSNSFVDILIKIGLDPYNGNHKTLNHRIKEEGFNLSTLEENRKKTRKKHMDSLSKKNSYNLEDILVENSNYNRRDLKNKLIKTNIFDNVCSCCGNNGEWLGKSLSLQLDHINGINNDNRLENLRLLCPNCHSQTDTYCGKHKKNVFKCLDCGKQVNKKSKRCVTCANNLKNKLQRKFEISKEELQSLVKKYPMTKVGELLGVSDNAVRKRCKILGILKSERG